MKKTNHILFQILILSWLFSALSVSAASVSVGSTLTDTLPTVTTKPVYDISATSAKTGGIVNSSGGSPVIARGVCWGTTEEPTLEDNYLVNGTGTGTFFSNLQGLAPGVTYYVRAYATNSMGTGYGEALPFTTLNLVTHIIDSTRCIFPPQYPPIDSMPIHIIDSLPVIIDSTEIVLIIDTILDTGTPESNDITCIFHLSHGHDVILHLTVLPTSYTETACFEYLWPRTGQVYTNSGTYFCPYMLHGQLVTDTLYLTVIKPSVTVASIPPVTVCENQTVNFSANATGSGNVALNWSGPGHFSGGSSEVSLVNATLDMSGVYTVTATTMQGDCKATASASVSVTVNPLPEVHISGNAIICQNGNTTLTATGAESYLWSTGSASNSITVAPTASTTYSVVGTDENQCQNSAAVFVTVNELPEVTVSGDSHICDGETAQLTASGAQTYVWSTGNTGATINVNPDETTVYTVEGTDENDCSNTATFTVTVGEGGDDTVHVSACESYYWPISGQTYTASGYYPFNYNNNQGCLSYHTLHLTITHDETHEISISKCESYTWPASGATYTESGTYYSVTTTPTGCNVTEVLRLNINHGTHDEETDWNCEAHIWAANGELYTESGDYVFEYTNLNGCPSSKTLHLTIKHGQDDDEYETVYGNSYTWPRNGETYLESGDYVYHYVNDEDCPCTITLHLTLIYQEEYPRECIEVIVDQHESCDPGEDGIVHLKIPAFFKSSDYEVEWNIPGVETSSQISVDGLSEGTYSVKVTSKKCSNVTFFKRQFTIEKEDDCDLELRISGPRNVAVGCDELPTVTFTATASGGAPPYTYEGWNGNSKTVTIPEGTTIITCKVRDRKGRTATAALNVAGKKMDCAHDPNEIAGPVGYHDTLRFVNATDKMNYTINFENDPDFATAPASRVSVTYDVPANQNIASFRLADFGFGSHLFTVPSNVSSYSQRLDVSDSLGVWVDVTAGIDIVNHKLFWIFQSINPATGFEPSSSQMGFLPINDSLSHGEGYVSFYILPDGGVETGDTVAAEALIVFDDNAPIGTNVWRNTFDAVAPTSTLHAELNAQDSLYCTFSFTAQDDQGGSGVRSVETFVSVNNGAYTSIGSCSPDSTLSYALENGLFYQFMSLATDNVGNTEPFKSVADTSVNFNVAPFDLILTGTTFYEYVPLNTYIGTFTTLDDDMNQTFVYELVGGAGSADNNLFAIVGNELRTNALFECSHRTDYTVRVRTTDIGGLSFEKEFSLTEFIQHETPVTFINAAICAGDSYHHHGHQLTVAGAYTDTVNSADGCDSIVTLFLTVNPVYHISFSQEICQGNYYDFNGILLSEPGIYTDTLQSVKGCDSIVTLNLTVNPIYHISIPQEICQGDSFDFHGVMLTQSGIYTDTLPTLNRCDSIVTLTLTVNPIYNTSISTEICDGESYDFFGQILTTTGTYTHTLQTVSGCDSVVSLTLTVNPSYHQTYEVDILCQGERFLLGGQYITESGIYIDSAQTVNGCDSITTLILTINPVDTIDFAETACDSYVWNGVPYFQSGDYTEILTNQYGCDSIVTLHLTIFNSNASEFTETACDSYTWGDETYTQTGDYTQTFTNAAGCDSTVTLHLTILYSTHIVETETACESFAWHGATYTTSGIYTYEYTNAVGCASADTLHLTVNHGTHNAETETACESFTWHGTTYASSGTYTYEYTNADGCPSVDTLYLTVLYGTHNAETETACESFTWHETTYTTSGTYTYAYNNTDGCPSVDTLYLTVLYGTHNVETETACESFTWHETTYTTSGTYTYEYTNAVGCASADTLHLTVNHGTHNVDTETACETFTWHGQTYTESGTYVYNYTNTGGCVSADTLHLTILSTVTGEVEATACDSYTWNGTTYTTSGEYMQTFSGANGCDSVVTLNLTIHYSTVSDFEITTADSCYEWNTQVYCETGDYVQTLQTADGCDSVVTLHLTITVSIDDHELSGIEVFPNPTNHILNIKGGGMRHIDIFNADGQLVYTKENDGSNLVQVDVTRFAAGQYFVKVRLGDGRTATRKVVVSRR